jgi:DNA-binding transcriptional MerR regulator
LFRAGDVVALLRLSRRQLHYWASTNRVRPSARTPGGHSRYSFEGLVALKTAKRLIDAGVSLQRIRNSIERLRLLLPRVRHPLTELVLVTTGDVVLAFHQGSAVEAISGQEWMFPVAKLEREVRAWRAGELAPRDAADSSEGAWKWTA